MQLQEFAEEFKILLVLVLGNFVDVFEQLKGIDNGQIPPELRSLSKHNANPACIFLPMEIRRQPHHLNMTRSWHKNPRKHFDGRRLPRPVGADVSHQFPAFKGEVHVVNGFYDVVFARDCATKASPKPLAAFMHLEVLA